MMPKKDFPLELALNELFNIDNDEEIIITLNQVTQSYTEIIQTIYDDIPKAEDGEGFIETLSVKILITTKSIINLTQGFTFETNTKISQFQFVDFSSIHILTRSIIESFLTLEYLFYNDLSE